MHRLCQDDNYWRRCMGVQFSQEFWRRASARPTEFSKPLLQKGECTDKGEPEALDYSGHCKNEMVRIGRFQEMSMRFTGERPPEDVYYSIWNFLDQRNDPGPQGPVQGGFNFDGNTDDEETDTDGSEFEFFQNFQPNNPNATGGAHHNWNGGNWGGQQAIADQ